MYLCMYKSKYTHTHILISIHVQYIYLYILITKFLIVVLTLIRKIVHYFYDRKIRHVLIHKYIYCICIDINVCVFRFIHAYVHLF